MRPAVIILTCLLAAVQAQREEASLRKDLFEQYDPLARPASPSETVEVTVGLSLTDVQVNKISNLVSLHGWVHMQWTDSHLAWDPEQYGGLTSTRFLPREVWTPDLVPYDMRPRVHNDWLNPQLVVVYSNGTVLYVPPTAFFVRCQRDTAEDLTRFSRGTHSCRTTLGLWTYHAGEVDLRPRSDTVDIRDFSPSSPWHVENGTLSHHVRTYPCCTEQYASIDIELVLKFTQ